MTKATKVPVEKRPVPISLEEAFDILNAMMEEDPEGGEQFKKADDQGEDVTYLYHNSLGRWLRNNWGLWKREGPLYEWFVCLGLHHPDDMSGLILTSFWRHLNGKPLDIDSQVASYQKYWEREQRGSSLTSS